MWWCPSAKIRSAILPTGGPHGGVSRCLRTMPSITAWTSSSFSTLNAPRMTAAPSLATRSAPPGPDSHGPALPAMSRLASFSWTTCSERKLVSTNSPSDAPIWSLRRGMMAVCGIFRPMGYLNRAVTANQSASAPTIPPSAAARTYSSHGYCFCRAKAKTNTTAMAISRLSARSFILRSAAAFSASPALSCRFATAERTCAGRERAGPAGGASGWVVGSEFTCMCPA